MRVINTKAKEIMTKTFQSKSESVHDVQKEQ